MSAAEDPGEARRAYRAALLDPRGDEGPAAPPPAMARADAVRELVREALRASSAELIVGRRALLAGGDTREARADYNRGAERVRAALDGAATETRLARAAAGEVRAALGEDAASLRPQLEALQKAGMAATDATARADLIRRTADMRARLQRAEREEEDRALRPVTDLLLDARSERLLENLRLVASRAPALAGTGHAGQDHDDDAAPAADPRYHPFPEPIRWYAR